MLSPAQSQILNYVDEHTGSGILGIAEVFDMRLSSASMALNALRAKEMLTWKIWGGPVTILPKGRAFLDADS